MKKALQKAQLALSEQHDLPVSTTPTLPFRLRRRGAPRAVTCAAYSVTCIPGTSPARGVVHQLSSGAAHFEPSDFCRTDGAAGSSEGWLPPWIGSQRRLVPGEEKECTCPGLPLFPNRGQDVPPGTLCVEGASFRLLRHPLAPLPPRDGWAASSRR